MEIRITIQNADEIKKAFQEAPLKLAYNLNRAIARIIVKVENEAKKSAPVNKSFGGGNLRKSIYSQMSGLVSGAVIVGSPYGIYVHEGTKPHEIKIKYKKVLANRRTNQIFGTRVQHPGTRPQPFLQEAIDNSEAFINSEFEKTTENII